MPWIIGGAALAGDLLGSVFGSNSAARANRANIKLAREQRAWEEQMSNTAVWRRRRDIEQAGGNPALAFTGGQSASTPSVSAPTVEPTFRPEWSKGAAGTAAMMALNAKQLQAQTTLTTAQARQANVEADIRELLRDQEREFRANRFTEQIEWDDIRTELLRSQSTSSAAQAKRAEESVDAIIRHAKALAATQELTEKNLRRIVEMQGLQWKDIASIILQMVK